MIAIYFNSGVLLKSILIPENYLEKKLDVQLYKTHLNIFIHIDFQTICSYY